MFYIRTISQFVNKLQFMIIFEKSQKPKILEINVSFYINVLSSDPLLINVKNQNKYFNNHEYTTLHF